MNHKYSPEEIEFLKENVVGRSVKELTAMFNDRYDTKIGSQAIGAVLKRYGFKSGIDARFKKGQPSWNKGMKGLQMGGKETQFKKGHTPVNYRPVGSERINIEGYTEIKVADPNKWRLKHNVIWEEAYGPIPKGHCLLFLDTNRQNLSLDNLQLISRSQLARLNQYRLIKDDADLTKTGIIIADIYNKVAERKKAK